MTPDFDGKIRSKLTYFQPVAETRLSPGLGKRGVKSCRTAVLVVPCWLLEYRLVGNLTIYLNHLSYLTCQSLLTVTCPRGTSILRNPAAMILLSCIRASFAGIYVIYNIGACIPLFRN